jgi:hypothetical protein
MRKIFLPLALLTGPVLAGCTLSEVSLTEPESVLVAEVYLEVGDGVDELSAFLHWTLGDKGPSELSDASIRLMGEGGLVLDFIRGARDECLAQEILDDVEGVCFRPSNLEDGLVRPGDHLEVEITLPNGDGLRGGVTLPGGFGFLKPEVVGACALPPGEPLELIWSPSEGAWAYVAETLIWGLREALAPQGIVVEEDSLTLLGLSITEADTTLVFPMEFGVFDRFELDYEIAQALQEGMPLGAKAEVVVAAADRNYVNWVRGGNFNPSGAVRIPSLVGEGVGVLGAVVRRLIRIEGAQPGGPLPSCLPISP